MGYKKRGIGDKRFAGIFATAYLIFAIFWILLSDWVVERYSPTVLTKIPLQTIKGLLFLSATALLFYWILERNRKKIDTLREQANHLYDEAPCVYISLSFEGMIVAVNAFGASHLGYKDQGLIGKNFLDLVYKEDRAFFHTVRAACLQNGALLYSADFRVQHSKQNTILWFRAHCRTIEDESLGTLFLLACQDITELHGRYQSLVESESKYRLIVEQMKDLVWTMNSAMQYTYVSPSVLRMRGYTSEEMMEQSLDEVLAPSSVSVATAFFIKELESEFLGMEDFFRYRTIDLELKKKNGSTVWVETQVSVLRDSSGTPTGLQGAMREIRSRNPSHSLYEVHP
ncbi:MAG: PAS domain S-box protein [Candidatus Ratteibacteria bacterium]